MPCLATFEGLPALSLARLIETKLACGEGNLRRTHKDFADVVELIAVHDLVDPLLGTCTSQCERPIANWYCGLAGADFFGKRLIHSDQLNSSACQYQKIECETSELLVQ